MDISEYGILYILYLYTNGILIEQDKKVGPARQSNFELVVDF